MPQVPAKTASCLVVMYHFVRDVEQTPYPGIKARRVAEFASQVEYLCRHYQPVRAADLIAFFDGRGELPRNGFYLTFDDGFIDHLCSVVPVLKRFNLEGAFFPMLEPLVSGRVPSVEKLRFLNYNCNFEAIYEEFFDTLARLFPAVDATPWRFGPAQAQQAAAYARFDQPKLAHFKRTTTLEMDWKIRDAVLDEMFPRHFGGESDFIRALYMNWDDLRRLRCEGMVVGGHTMTHPWLARLGAGSQETEIVAASERLSRELAEPIEVFAYPYGSYNQDTLSILRRRGCRLAFTTKVDTNLESGRPLEVPRLDTNDVRTAEES
jgi:peptidoglycan/xylan/chitin deacetylase (PgdA/CDA1 family)